MGAQDWTIRRLMGEQASCLLMMVLHNILLIELSSRPGIGRDFVDPII